MKPYVELLKALADETRLRIIRLLLANQTATCVCELVDALEERQYNVSRHLQVLEAAGALEAEKEGRWVYYRLREAHEAFLQALYRTVMALPAGDEIVAADQARFHERLRLRDGGRCRVGIQKPYLIGGKRHGRR